MSHEEKLIEALSHWESLGNTPEELGDTLYLATRKGELPVSEETHTARQKIKRLPYGNEILQEEMK